MLWVLTDPHRRSNKTITDVVHVALLLSLFLVSPRLTAQPSSEEHEIPGHSAPPYYPRSDADDRSIDFLSLDAVHSAAALQAYGLLHFPREHYSLTLRRLDDYAYKFARSVNTVEAYDDYLAAYPDGRHSIEAREGRTAAEEFIDDHSYENAMAVNTVQAYQDYLTKHPDGRHVAEARAARSRAADALDDYAYAHAHNIGTAEAYDGYLLKYPAGRHLDDARANRAIARQSVDDRAYELARRANTVRALDAYLLAYPSGRHFDKALKLRSELTAIDDAAFHRALAQGTTGSYKRYLRDFADGRHRLAAIYLMPDHEFRDCDNCPTMVVVPKGTYLMGSSPQEEKRRRAEGPQHFVTIADQLAVGKYEVTHAEFSTFVNATGYSTGSGCWWYDVTRPDNPIMKPHQDRNWKYPGYEPGPDDPVICINWRDARAYLQWLSDETLSDYRLLSEAEWEYLATRGSPGLFRNILEIPSTRANFNRPKSSAGSCECYRQSEVIPQFQGPICLDGRVFCHYRPSVVPVGRSGSDGLGIHGLHGNVWEWTEDCWSDNYVGAPTDGSPRTDGNCGIRVLRGGSWRDDAEHVRTAARGRNDINLRADFNGFRVATVLHPDDSEILKRQRLDSVALLVSK